MKKFLIAALLVLCLSGCSGDSNSDTSSVASAVGDVEIEVSEPTGDSSESEASADAESSASSLKDVFAEIKSSVVLPEMVELNDNLLERYYGLSTDVVADYAGGVDSSGVGQDEIVLMKAVDESGVETIRQALQTRYDSKLAQQENYNPDEAEKIRNCEVRVIGEYVTLIISNDAASINEIVNSKIG